MTKLENWDFRPGNTRDDTIHTLRLCANKYNEAVAAYIKTLPTKHNNNIRERNDVSVTDDILTYIVKNENVAKLVTCIEWEKPKRGYYPFISSITYGNQKVSFTFDATLTNKNNPHNIIYPEGCCDKAYLVLPDGIYEIKLAPTRRTMENNSICLYDIIITEQITNIKTPVDTIPLPTTFKIAEIVDYNKLKPEHIADRFVIGKDIFPTLDEAVKSEKNEEYIALSYIKTLDKNKPLFLVDDDAIYECEYVKYNELGIIVYHKTTNYEQLICTNRINDTLFDDFHKAFEAYKKKQEKKS